MKGVTENFTTYLFRTKNLKIQRKKVESQLKRNIEKAIEKAGGEYGFKEAL